MYQLDYLRFNRLVPLRRPHLRELLVRKSLLPQKTRVHHRQQKPYVQPLHNPCLPLQDARWVAMKADYNFLCVKRVLSLQRFAPKIEFLAVFESDLQLGLLDALELVCEL